MRRRLLQLNNIIWISPASGLMMMRPTGRQILNSNKMDALLLTFVWTLETGFKKKKIEVK